MDCYLYKIGESTEHCTVSCKSVEKNYQDHQKNTEELKVKKKT